MYPVFRSLLFKFDPETAHHLTLQLLRLGGQQPLESLLRLMFAVPEKPVDAFGLCFPNPVGLAAGYDKDGVAVRGLAALCFGHIEIGTVTPRPQPGNPKPRVFRLMEDEAVINRMGFPGVGMDPVVRSLRRALQPTKVRFGGEFTFPDKRPKAVIGVNLGKNKDTPNEEAVFDYLELLQAFAPLADYLTINVSSPNTIGLRDLQGRDALQALLHQLHGQRSLEEKRLKKKLPLLVKLAPDLGDAELDDALAAIIDTGMDGVIATNTTLARPGLRSTYQAESGGLSGHPLTGISDVVLKKVVARVDGRIPVVGVGGVMHPDDARRKLDLGARLVQVYTGLIYRGPGLVKEIVREI